LDISTIEPSLAGPKRPQDRVFLSKMPEKFPTRKDDPEGKTLPVRAISANGFTLEDRPVVIAVHHQLHQHLQSFGG
jgi:aconitate hydratase